MGLKNLLTDYKKSLKHPAAEEIADLVFFRPVAFLFVRILVRFPITPNQISGVAMALGVAAGLCFAGGGRREFAAGGLLYCLSNVFDCCDGMIARLKKNGTRTGRIVDGLVDYISGIAVYTGLGIGLAHASTTGTLHLPCNSWLLVVAAAASAIAHAIASDKHRNAFLEAEKPGAAAPGDDYSLFSQELKDLDRQAGRRFDKLLITLYLKYLRLQSGRKTAANTGSSLRTTAGQVAAWNLLGPSTHISFLCVAAISYAPMIFFWYVIGAANILLLLLPAWLRFFPGTAEKDAS